MPVDHGVDHGGKERRRGVPKMRDGGPVEQGRKERRDGIGGQERWGWDQIGKGIRDGVPVVVSHRRATVLTENVLGLSPKAKGSECANRCSALRFGMLRRGMTRKRIRMAFI